MNKNDYLSNSPVALLLADLKKQIYQRLKIWSVKRKLELVDFFLNEIYELSLYAGVIIQPFVITPSILLFLFF